MKIKIASPCSARWEDMTGDERSRFCQHCKKHVYNFTEMSAEEVTALIEEKEGRVCARIYQRADGKALTENCPRGFALVSRRMKFAVCSVIAFLLVMGAAFARKKKADASAGVTHGPILQKVDKAVVTVKSWVGIQPQPMIAGKICVPSPKITQTNAPAKK